MHWWKKAIYILVVSNLVWSCSSHEQEEKALEKKLSFLDYLAQADYTALETSYQALELDTNFVKNYPAVKRLKERQFFFPKQNWKNDLYLSLTKNHAVRDSSSFHFTGYNTQKKGTVHLYTYPPDTNICVLEIHE
ncbi:hypothetical protein SAMN05216474_2634 [Lishizhenia tianjinensis]|uniref:Uncharacterized protein n=1 Tax=Lishizhenia tianjinensis TaxID=477690 RepID=A0A1I7BAS8_9FLAO|nr:hypothetical protein [Lishizhenia tianjinensis]SFT84320.1 hypothetical protein SAMN05216474_2634 [Lishizhenia tianjinensis]